MAVDAEGRLFVADRAVREVLRRLRRWRVLGAVMDLPFVRPLAKWAYGYVARHRSFVARLLRVP
jgi:predicted DCC family thiol-disulfide oxidoreductase YuxK